MAGHRADGADAQAVVAAEHHGHRALRERVEHGGVQRLVPGHHLGQVPVALLGRLPGVGGSAEVAAVEHPQAVALQHGFQARHPKGFRSHGGAACARADVGGHANEVNRLLHGAIVGEAQRGQKAAPATRLG